MTVSRRAGGCAAALLFLGEPAYAQFDPQSAVDRAISRTCSDRGGQVVSRERLAQALLIESSNGLPGDLDAVDAMSSPDAVEQQAVQRARSQRHQMVAVKSLLLEKLSTPGTSQAAALSVSPPPPQSPTVTVDWLFTGEARYRLSCAPQKPAAEPAFAELPLLTVRKSAAELSKMGKERKAAGSAQVGYEVSRTKNLAGDIKKTRKLLVNAALGLKLAGNEDSYAIAYGEYTRSRARIETEPTPIDPKKNGSADDVNALELGVLGTRRFGYALRATGRLGYVVDYTTDAAFAVGGLTLIPITGGGIDLGICNFGSFKNIGLGIDAQCGAALEADVRHVLRRGDAELSAKDYIIAAGPVAGITFRRALDINGKPQDGLVGSVTYRYLPVLTGSAPDLKRLESALTYRWWSDDLGFDLGFTFVRGIERKSLSHERRFGFMFGLIY